MKDIRNLELPIVNEITELKNTFSDIEYAITSVAIIKNPYKNGKLDFAVKPFIRDGNNNYVQV